MQINIVVKMLIANGLLLASLGAFAWTVPENITDQSKETEEHTEISLDNVTMSKEVVYEEKEQDLNSESLVARKKRTARKIERKDGGVFEKVPASLNSEEQAAVDYQDALKQFGNGDDYQAEKVLLNALNSKPNHHVSRIELATLYLKRERIEDAERVVQEGLRIDENNPDYLKLMAIIYDKREEPEKALTLLVKVKDSRKHDKNYVAFLGHIYQQTGQYALARQQYFRLLQAEPKNPIWLLGVSIALDAEGQRDAALEGYRQISKEGRIDPKVLRYVQDRIKSLKG